MNKAALYAIPLLFVTLNVGAADTQKNLTENAILAGWENKQVDSVPRAATSYPLSRIEQLERENEQLRNSITQMRTQLNAINPSAGSNDVSQKNAQIQALVEENNRLSKRISTLEKSRRNASKGAQERALTALQSEIDQLRVNNEQLRASLAQSNAGTQTAQGLQSKIIALTATIRALENERNTLQTRVHDLENQNIIYAQNADDKSEVQARQILNLQTQLADTEKQKNLLAAQILTTDKLLAQTTQLANDSTTRVSALEKQVTALKTEIDQLSLQNASFQSVMNEKDQTIAQISNKANNIEQSSQTYLQEINGLKTDIMRMTEEKKALQDQIAAKDAQIEKAGQESANKAQSKSSLESEIADLKKQNQSLRQTIKAQNEVLVSADNATTTAERLLSENVALKNRLEQVSKSKDNNSKSAQDLMALNQKLQSEIIKRDTYIAQLEPLKETIKALQQQNAQNGASSVETSDSLLAKRLKIAQGKLQEAEKALEKEKLAAGEYRKKIREYQEQVGKVGASASVAQMDKVNMLQLENQTLKARIKLLSTQNNRSTDIVPQNSVKYVETLYPKVDEVRPLLDQNGNRIDSIIQLQDNAQLANDMNPEELLSQKLKPLSSVNN